MWIGVPFDPGLGAWSQTFLEGNSVSPRILVDKSEFLKLRYVSAKTQTIGRENYPWAIL